MSYYISDLHLFCKSQAQEGCINYDKGGGRYKAHIEISRTAV